MPYDIDESCVINSISDYPIDSIEHYLNDAVVWSREVELLPQAGCDVITTKLTLIDNINR